MSFSRTISFRNCSKTIKRFQSVISQNLVYAEYGEPTKVISKCEEILSCNLKSDDVLIKMLAAPINPADINTIQGKYPSKPELPAVPGNEGVGEIIHLGDGVKDFNVGDRVVPFTNLLGTWRSHAVLDSSQLYKVPKALGLAEACTLTVNPCTAYRMLQDFVSLKEGDVVIQNGANSACGQNVIQLCKIWGIKNINIVRNRANIDELKTSLCNLGASEVLTEEELRTTDIFKQKKYSRPKLALNCVGGKSSLEVLRQLDHGGVMVTYGGMSKEPVTVPTASFIFKDLQLRGFWMTAWTKKNYQCKERSEMLNQLVQLMVDKKLVGPAHELVDFRNYEKAISNSLTDKGMGLKQILHFTDC